MSTTKHVLIFCNTDRSAETHRVKKITDSKKSVTAASG